VFSFCSKALSDPPTVLCFAVRGRFYVQRDALTRDHREDIPYFWRIAVPVVASSMFLFGYSYFRNLFRRARRTWQKRISHRYVASRLKSK
jgi:hypothetical protein